MNKSLLYLLTTTTMLLAPACTGAIDSHDDPSPLPAPAKNPTPPAPRPALGAPMTTPDPAQPGTGMPPATSAPPAAGKMAFACTPTATPPGVPLRRLSRIQVVNTLRDLITFALKDGKLVDGVMREIAVPLSRLPQDQRLRTNQDPQGSFRRFDQAVAQGWVDAVYDIAQATAAALTTPTTITSTVGACALAAGDAGICLDDFVRRVGERTLRRAIGPDDLKRARAIYGSVSKNDAAAFRDVLASWLASPSFLYLLEHGDSDISGRNELRTLTAPEQAARLSYHFWGTMPDETLWSAVKSGALLTADGYRKQVERMFLDARTRAAVDEFFADWLKLEETPHLDENAGRKSFKAFAGMDLPTGGLRQAMVDEVMSLVRAFVWDRAGGVDDLLTTPLSFTRSSELARLYGVPVWMAGTEPAAFPRGTRPGLITRAAFLSTGIVKTRPIHKGVFIRSTLLCDPLPQPPPEAQNSLPDIDKTLTTRKQTEAITENGNSVCAGCHKTLINPLGFATEGFDALGRERSDELLFDPTKDDGVILARRPVDARTVPQVVRGDQTVAEGPADLVRLMKDSGKIPACLARHYFRFTFGRYESDATDGCALERLRAAFAQSGNLRAALRDVALTPEFQQRSFASAR